MDAELSAVLSRHLGAVSVSAILRTARNRLGAEEGPLSPVQGQALLSTIRVGLRTFLGDARRREVCLEEVRQVLGLPKADGLHTVSDEADVVACRTAARELCAAIGFSAVDQTKVATVVSELARNIVRYARRGTVVLKELTAAGATARGIEVVARDEGPGIANVGGDPGGTLSLPDRHGPRPSRGEAPHG